MGSLTQVVHLIQQVMIASFITFVTNHQSTEHSNSESVQHPNSEHHQDFNHHGNPQSNKDNNNYLNQPSNTCPDDYFQIQHVQHLKTCINQPLNQYPDHHFSSTSSSFSDVKLYYKWCKIKYYKYKNDFRYIIINSMIIESIAHTNVEQFDNNNANINGFSGASYSAPIGCTKWNENIDFSGTLRASNASLISGKNGNEKLELLDPNPSLISVKNLDENVRFGEAYDYGSLGYNYGGISWLWQFR